jgi:SAM-dependent methyltransferase
MVCPRCRQISADDVPRCTCGYRFGRIAATELPQWYAEYQQLVEDAYLPAETPWQQSGKSGSFEDWTRLRIPVCKGIDTSGTFLDIGCVNGFLLGCLLDWTKKKGVSIVPYGLDLSPKLVALARARLPQFRSHKEDLSRDWIDERIRALGLIVARCLFGFSGDGLELCRVAVVRMGGTAQEGGQETLPLPGGV